MRFSGYPNVEGLLAQTFAGGPGDGELLHHALIYDSVDDFVEAALPFVRAGIDAGEPVLARVKQENAAALSAVLGADSSDADVAPAEGFYETPSRTRAKLLDWVSANGEGNLRMRVIGESPWPLDFDAGIREWERHESVTNVAFRGLPVSFACPYDASSLPEEIIESAESTHPLIMRSGATDDSSAYSRPDLFCEQLNAQTPVRTSVPMLQMPFDIDNLSAVRKLVEDEGAAAGLSGDRLFDHTLAVDEVATNAILHGVAPARLKLWREPGELIWEVSDAGPGIRDPLAGQIAPDPVRDGRPRHVDGAPDLRRARVPQRQLGDVVSLHVAVPAG